MWAIQASEQSANFLGKNHNIPIVRLGNERDSVNGKEVPGPCQRDSDSVPRVGTVGNEVHSFERRDARVLDPELLVGREGAGEAGVRNGSGSAVKRNPSSLRAKPMIDRPVFRWNERA